MQARIGMRLLERTDAVERFALDIAELALVVAEMTYARNTAKGPLLRQSVPRHAIEWNALDIDISSQRRRQSHQTGVTFGQEIPPLMSTKLKPPPVLPPHLLQVILNKDTPLVCEPTLLPTPNHVMVNHVYALSIKDSVMVMSSTGRFKKKYVTTILYKPI